MHSYIYAHVRSFTNAISFFFFFLLFIHPPIVTAEYTLTFSLSVFFFFFGVFVHLSLLLLFFFLHCYLLFSPRSSLLNFAPLQACTIPFLSFF